MTPTISVITAVYNRVDSIGHALASVQSQSWRDVEHLVIDGGSTDGTVELLEAQRDHIAVLVIEPDRGIYDALNKGLSRFSGEIVGLMHSDDFFADTGVLERVATAFEDPAVDGVYGDLEYVAKNDTTRVVRHWKSGPYRPSRLAWGWMPPHPALFLRRTVIEQWGYYDIDLQIAADYDAMLRYLKQGEIRLAYIPEVLVKMRLGGESNRSLARIFRKSREDYQSLRRNKVGGLGTLLCKNIRKLPQFFRSL